jgi:tubulin--tyrosine ligase-like protein 12
LDEFGSRIGRSDDPNVRVVPFFFVWSGEAFSLLFPIKNIGPAETVNRGYLDAHEPNEKRRIALKLPWVPCDLSSESVEQVDPGEEYFRVGSSVSHPR